LFIPQKPCSAHWRKAVLLRGSIPLSQRHWLLERASLTEKLAAHAKGDLKVVVLHQQIQRPLYCEARKLRIPHDARALVREVALLGCGTPWVYARTIIPLTSLKGSLKRLRYLGSRSLGSALFADPNLQRGELQLAPIDTDYLPSSPLLAHAQPAWGRRSVFTLKSKPLLVTEVFLESLWNNH